MISTRVCKKIFLIKAKIKFCTGCPKIYDQNLHFWIFSKNSFRNELNAPCLHYFDTHDLTCKKFHLVRRGAPGGPRTLKKFFWYLKIISIRVCKKIFLIKAKILFCTWCPKSAVHPRTQNFWNIFFHMQKNIAYDHKFWGMGCL